MKGIEVFTNLAILIIYIKLPITRCETKEASNPLILLNTLKRKKLFLFFYTENITKSFLYNEMPKEHTTQNI